MSVSDAVYESLLAQRDEYGLRLDAALARVKELEAENERLRAALTLIATAQNEVGGIARAVLARGVRDTAA